MDGQTPVAIKFDDPGVIRERGRAYAKALAKNETTAGEVRSTWRGLGDHYEAPEAGELLRAMVEPDETAAQLASDGRRVRSALDSYADRLDELIAERAALMGEAQSIREDFDTLDAGDVVVDESKTSARYPQGEPTLHRGEVEARENELRRKIALLRSNKDQAEIDCANAIGDIWGAPEIKMGGKAHIDYQWQYGQTSEGYEQLAEAGDAPWGRPAHWTHPGAVPGIAIKHAVPALLFADVFGAVRDASGTGARGGPRR